MDAGEVIRDARDRRCVSQLELARRLGVTRSTVARWERGVTTITTLRLDEVLAAMGYGSRVTLLRARDSPDLEIDLLRAMEPGDRIGAAHGLQPFLWSRHGLVLDGPVAGLLQGVPTDSDEVVVLVTQERLPGVQHALVGWTTPIPGAPPFAGEFAYRTAAGRLLVRVVDEMPSTELLPTCWGPLTVVTLAEVDVDEDLRCRVLRRRWSRRSAGPGPAAARRPV